MTEDEAREEICQIWLAWSKRTSATPAVEQLRFLKWLDEHRPDLLNLSGTGKDAWVKVWGWIDEFENASA